MLKVLTCLVGTLAVTTLGRTQAFNEEVVHAKLRNKQPKTSVDDYMREAHSFVGKGTHESIPMFDLRETDALEMLGKEGLTLKTGQ